MGERRRRDPGVEGCLVAPPGDDQPDLPVVVGLEQLEALEPVGTVDGARSVWRIAGPVRRPIPPGR